MKLRCFHCDQELEITSTQLGGDVRCPHCQSPIRLPQAQPEDPSAEGRFALRMQRCLRGSVSALVSVVVHMSLLFVLALVTCDYRSDEGWSDEVLIGQLPSVDLTGDELPQLDAEAISSHSPSQLETALDLVEPPSGSAGDDALEIDIAAMTASGAFGAEGGELNLMGGGGGGGRVGDGASFMGLQATGRRFLIIADRSGSMRGARFAYLKNEILETIDSMNDQARFQLIFFSSQPLQFPQPGWRHPRRDRAAIEQWLQSVDASGGTIPSPAFRVAFSMEPKPDAIFFMTDGIFAESAVSEIAAMNPGPYPVPIHTISFVDRTSETIMRTIAQQSGGNYRHVAGF